MTVKIQINELPTQQVVRWCCESVRVFSFCCQLWHIRAFTGFGMSSLQVKVNTRDPTHGAAVSGWDESFLPGQTGVQGVNVRRGRGGLLRVSGSASAVPCGAFRKTSFAVACHFPTAPYCSTPLTSIPSPHPSLPSSTGPGFSGAKRTHKQAATCTEALTHSHKERHTMTKLLKSFLILSGSAAVCPLVWLFSDSSK